MLTKLLVLSLIILNLLTTHLSDLLPVDGKFDDILTHRSAISEIVNLRVDSAVSSTSATCSNTNALPRGTENSL